MWTFYRNRFAQRAFGAFVFAPAILAASIASAQVCPFDNGGSTLENDGLVLTRYALGLRGAPMLANTSFAAGDAATIESNIACPSCGLRVTDDKDGLGNPIFTTADATIISRKLAGFGGTALTNGLALGSGSRNTTQAVQSFLLAGCGATGGTVTRVDSGLGIIATGPAVTNGSFTTTGRIELANGFILPQGCTPGQVPKSNGSGAWNCAADDAGTGSGGGTVTNITLGAGLTNNVTIPLTSGGTITNTGTILLTDSYRLPQTCGVGQIPSRAGYANQWICTDLPIVGNVFLQGGNAFGAPGVLGTTDAQNLRIVSGGNDLRATIAGKQHGLRITQATGAGVTTDTTPNVINGHESNGGSSIGQYAGITIAGGGNKGSIENNVATGSFATISGGTSHRAAAYATVAGGEFNRASSDLAAIGGGLNNAASEYAAFIGGGINNSASGTFSTISGGNGNSAPNTYGTVSGGYSNRSAGNYSTASGGHTSYALGNYSAVSGGQGNTASGAHSVVIGGESNQATANWSTTLGGRENIASGLYSIAAGVKARASATGSFVWADTQPGEYFGGVGSETQTATNSFNIRASGGINFNLEKTNPFNGITIGMQYVTGVSQEAASEREGFLNFQATRLSAKSLFAATSIRSNGSLASNQGLMVSGFFGTTQCFIVGGGFCLGQSGEWEPVSDKAEKRDFKQVDVAKVLERVLELPVQYWSYLRGEVDGRYIGPVAQDFKRLFQVGIGDKTISPTNASGVALAAIQGLNQKLNEQATQIKARDNTIAKLTERLAAVEKRLGLK